MLDNWLYYRYNTKRWSSTYNVENRHMIKSFKDKDTEALYQRPIHPGEILIDELAEIGLRPVELAQRLGVPDNRIYQILHGRRSITADTALRLGKFFNTGPEFWLNLQQAYELDVARQEIGANLDKITPYQTAPNS